MPAVRQRLFAVVLCLGLLTLYAANSRSTLATLLFSVSPTAETAPMPHSGDSADDPAIWLHPIDTASSTIIGTDKLGGLAVYNLDGSQLQYLPDGNMNNVDLRYNFPLGNQRVALVTAGNRSNNSLAFYRVNPTTRLLENVAARTITPSITVYGSCMYHSAATGKYYLFINDKNGVVQQWELFATPAGLVDAVQVRNFSVGSQTEGCVADDELGSFYIGEEAVAIWKYGAEPSAGATHTLVDTTGTAGHLTSNIEGLSIYYASNGAGYLLASSQGSDTYVIYQREANNAYVATFSIVAGNGIDGTSGTDGIDVTNSGLGSAFPQGVFVAQDNTNDNNGNQNFKLVPWQSIADALTPPLTIDTNWDPRQVGAGAGPTIVSLSPASAATGGPDLTLTVDGANFVPGATVRWNGIDKPTTFVSSINLTASISAADIAAPGTVNVTVVNPAPDNTVSNTQAFTITDAPPPTPTPVGAPIKTISFEGGSLTDATTGADSTTGTVNLQTSAPLKGSYSATVPTTTSYGYLTENFSGVDDLYVSFYIKPASFPASARIAMVQNSGTTIGNLVLSSSGTLQLRNGTTSIGSASAALSATTLYRVGLHQRKGSGANGVLEAFLASGDNPFGTPFASSASESFSTQASKFQIGATNSNLVNATFDDIKLDSLAMPGPSSSDATPTATPTPTSTPISTLTPTSTPTATSAMPTLTGTPTHTPTPTSTPTDTVTPTSTPTATPTPAITNLLLNGGFELDSNGDGRPDSWSSNSRFTRSTTLVRSGGYAGKHFASNNANYTISQEVSNLQAGQSYRFSGAVNIPSTSDSFTFRLEIRWRNSSSSTLRTDVVKTYSGSTSGAWDQVTKLLSPAPTGTSNAQIRMVVSSLNATVYVDDFVFQTSSSAGNIIPQLIFTR